VRDPGLRRADVAGRAVAYRRAGDGPPLMLLHGGWGDGRQWLGELERLADAYDVVAWDAPGCGGSADPPDGADLGAYADALAGLAAALGLDRPHLCGLSWGGALALEVASRHPGLPRSLVLAGAYAGWAGSLAPEEVRARLDRVLDEAARPPEEWASGYLDGFFAGPVADEVRDAQLRMVLDVRPAGLVAMIRAMAAADLRPALPGVGVPVLVIHGGRDARSPPEVGRALHAAIPGARLVLLPDTGHVVNMEAPAAFERALRAFLTSVPGPAPPRPAGPPS
jgi:pimeloyl-ACP methyl ester carboxylesterase